ncbi:MAG: IS200/IS605 family transposase [Candidatus Thiodiazotropha sp.]
MPDYKSLTHTRWDCKYHVVFIPKRRQKLIYGQLRKVLGEILHELASRKGAEILEGHMMCDHIHMCISIPPKYSVSHIVGYIKGKSAIAIARKFRGKQRNFNGEHFWARGYFVSTVGLDEDMVREYIRHQEQNDERRVPTNTAKGRKSGSSFHGFGCLVA